MVAKGVSEENVYQVNTKWGEGAWERKVIASKVEMGNFATAFPFTTRFFGG